MFDDFPKWLIAGWLFAATATLAGAYINDDHGIGILSENLFWQFFGMGITVFGIDVILRHKQRVQDQPLRTISLENCTIAHARLIHLLERMLRAVHGTAWSGDPLSGQTVSDYPRLNLASSAPVFGGMGWLGYLPIAIADVVASFEAVYSRGSARDLPASLLSAVNQLEAGPAFNILQQLPMAVSARTALGQQTLTLPAGIIDQAFLQNVLEFRAELEEAIRAEQKYAKGQLPDRLQNFLNSYSKI